MSKSVHLYPQADWILAQWPVLLEGYYGGEFYDGDERHGSTLAPLVYTGCGTEWLLTGRLYWWVIYALSPCILGMHKQFIEANFMQ